MVMSKKMQNLVVLIEPSEYVPESFWKAENMILNRFCIDEDAAFELSGVYYLNQYDLEGDGEQKEKGKENSLAGNSLAILRWLKRHRRRSMTAFADMIRI